MMNEGLQLAHKPIPAKPQPESNIKFNPLEEAIYAPKRTKILNPSDMNLIDETPQTEECPILYNEAFSHSTSRSQNNTGKGAVLDKEEKKTKTSRYLKE